MRKNPRVPATTFYGQEDGEAEGVLIAPGRSLGRRRIASFRASGERTTYRLAGSLFGLQMAATSESLRGGRER
jgi:hypothetical protein